MKIFYSPEKKILDSKASDFFAYNTKKILDKKEFVLWAVPGGRSVAGIFRLLAVRADIPWEKLHFFIIDERLVTLDDPESNYRLLDENLTGNLVRDSKVPPGNVHPFIFKPEMTDKGLGDYETELKKFGGYFDIILLSSGEDGHIGGLYPRHHSIKEDAKYFFTMDDSPKPPKERMSSSRTLLLKSKAAVLLFYGDSKKNALKCFKNYDMTQIDCPAKIVSDINNSLVLTDQEINEKK